MKKVIKKFTPLIKQTNFQYKTPGTPGQVLDRPTTTDTGILSPDQQTLYRSGVGTLLQFSNKTRPDHCNPVRELSKSMDRATPSALKEMFRIIKYLIDTKDMGLKLAPKFTESNLQRWVLKNLFGL
jgi:hypothetical protein